MWSVDKLYSTGDRGEPCIRPLFKRMGLDREWVTSIWVLFPICNESIRFTSLEGVQEFWSVVWRCSWPILLNSLRMSRKTIVALDLFVLAQLRIEWSMDVFNIVPGVLEEPLWCPLKAEKSLNLRTRTRSITRLKTEQIVIGLQLEVSSLSLDLYSKIVLVFFWKQGGPSTFL